MRPGSFLLPNRGRSVARRPRSRRRPMNLPFPPSQDDSPRARFRCTMLAIRNAFDWSSILVLPGAAAARSTCSANRTAAAAPFHPSQRPALSRALPGCHAGLTLLPFASLPQLLVELLRSRRVRDARLWGALRASQHGRFQPRRDDARVGKMPLANLCNRSCCQRALLGATDLRATGSHPPVRRASRSPQVPHASTGREVLNGSAR